MWNILKGNELIEMGRGHVKGRNDRKNHKKHRTTEDHPRQIGYDHT